MPRERPSVTLEPWDDKAMAEQLGMVTFDRKHQDRVEREERDGILRAFQACAAAMPSIAVPAATTGPRTAYHVLSAQPDFPETLRGTPGVFWRQIEKLRAMGAVRDSSIRRADRHRVATLEATTEGARACGQ